MSYWILSVVSIFWHHVNTYRFAHDHNCLLLKDSCLHYIWENFVCVSQEEEFCDLPKDMLCSDSFLASENLRVDSEYQVKLLVLSLILISKPSNLYKGIIKSFSLNWPKRHELTLSNYTGVHGWNVLGTIRYCRSTEVYFWRPKAYSPITCYVKKTR